MVIRQLVYSIKALICKLYQLIKARICVPQFSYVATYVTAAPSIIGNYEITVSFEYHSRVYEHLQVACTRRNISYSTLVGIGIDAQEYVLHL